MRLMLGVGAYRPHPRFPSRQLVLDAPDLCSTLTTLNAPSLQPANHKEEAA